MTHSKVDQALKVAIGGLLVALAVLIVYSMQDHVVAVGDHAPNFTITTADGKTVTPRRLPRQGAGIELLGKLVPALRPGGALAQSVRQDAGAVGRGGAENQRGSQ